MNIVSAKSPARDENTMLDHRAILSKRPSERDTDSHALVSVGSERSK